VISGTNLELVVCLDSLGRPVVDRHRPLCQPVLLLELGEHQEERLAKLLRALLERLLEQVSSPLEFRSTLSNRFANNRTTTKGKTGESADRYRVRLLAVEEEARESEEAKKSSTNVTLDEFGKVDIPDLERDRESEEVDSSLVHLEALLKVLVLLKESSVVDDDLQKSARTREGIKASQPEMRDAKVGKRREGRGNGPGRLRFGAQGCDRRRLLWSRLCRWTLRDRRRRTRA
jgi:hypothetical protein